MAVWFEPGATYFVIDDPHSSLIVSDETTSFLIYGAGGCGGSGARPAEEPKPELAFERKPSHKLTPLERAQQSRAAKGDLLMRMRR